MQQQQNNIKSIDQVCDADHKPVPVCELHKAQIEAIRSHYPDMGAEDRARAEVIIAGLEFR